MPRLGDVFLHQVTGYFIYIKPRGASFHAITILSSMGTYRTAISTHELQQSFMHHRIPLSELLMHIHEYVGQEFTASTDTDPILSMKSS